MTDIWLPGFEHMPMLGLPGGTYETRRRWKVCLHTTEGSTVGGAINAYKKYPPHIIIDRRTKRRVQHVPLNRHSYALLGRENEDEPVIQIEMVGFAGSTQAWKHTELDWIVDFVLMPIRAHCPFAAAYPPQGFGGSEGYGTRGRYRYRTDREWENFSGIVGHCHAPAPDKHWDPGNIDIDYIVDRVKLHERVPAPPEPGDTKMTFEAAHYVVRQTYLDKWGRVGDDDGMIFWVDVLMTEGYQGYVRFLRNF